MQFERLKFGAPPPTPEDKTQAGFLTKATGRRMAKLKEAEAALTMLPGPSETLHTILVGSFDLAHLLTVLLAKLGSRCRHMMIATLSLSVKNVSEMAGWLDSGQVEKLDILVSNFFQKHDRSIFNGLLQEFGQRNQKVASARCHAKIVLLSLADGRKYALSGSANLRSNGNVEALCVTNSPELHSWYEQWLEGVINAHEIDPRGDQEEG